jgi:hypothetical protein
MFHNLPFREPHDTSLHRTVFFRPATGLGQNEPPSFVAGGDRCSPETGVPDMIMSNNVIITIN